MADMTITQIVNGEIARPKIYEDDKVLAVVGWNPLSDGHILVIPREAAPSLDQLSDDSAAAVGRVLPRLCRAVMKATGAEHYNVLQNNGSRAHQTAFHVHFHIIPKPDPNSGLVIGWPSKGELSEEAQKALADRIRSAL